MASEEHVQLLHLGLTSWNAWRQGVGFTIRPDLIGADLRGMDLRKADLAGARLSESDMSEARLRETNLIGADLSDTALDFADLTNASLIGANLSQASLAHATLKSTSLSEADLGAADLSESDASNANLSHSDLSDAIFDGAKLGGSDLSGARLFRTSLDQTDLGTAVVGFTLFADLDLSNCLGLDSLVHRGPSTIGVDTLFRSGPGLPSEFFLGCGLAPSFYSYIDAHVTPMSLTHFRVFLSYSSVDSPAAEKIYGDLFNRHGIATWMDKHQMMPGDDIDEEIDQAINIKTDKMVLVCSKASLSGRSSWWIDREVTRALDRERDHQRKTGNRLRYLMPVVLDDFLFSKKCTYRRKSDLTERNVADFSGWNSDPASYDREMARLVNALRVTGPITPGGFR